MSIWITPENVSTPEMISRVSPGSREPDQETGLCEHDEADAEQGECAEPLDEVLGVEPGDEC